MQTEDCRNRQSSVGFGKPGHGLDFVILKINKDMTLEELMDIAPYSMGKEEKHAVLDEYLVNLTKYHYEHSEEYRKMLDGTGVDINSIKHYEDLPYLPVSLFKDLTLRSVAEDEVIKTMTSSGTTGQKTSKIYLDRETSANQTKTLTKIVSSLLGNKRVPMIILDSSNVVKDRRMFSARGAGILGFASVCTHWMKTWNSISKE